MWLFPSFEKVDKAEIERRARSLGPVSWFEKRSIQKLSGGQRQRVADCLRYQWTTSGPFRWALVCTDLKLRTDMQYELRELQQCLDYLCLCYSWPRRSSAMSDWFREMSNLVHRLISMMNWINHFVATFNGSPTSRWSHDRGLLVEFNGKTLWSGRWGMRPNEPVEVVIRPEDLQITLPWRRQAPSESDTQLFRGVHYEIIAYDDLGNEDDSPTRKCHREKIGLDWTRRYPRYASQRNRRRIRCTDRRACWSGS